MMGRRKADDGWWLAVDRPRRGGAGCVLPASGDLTGFFLLTSLLFGRAAGFPRVPLNHKDNDKAE